MAESGRSEETGGAKSNFIINVVRDKPVLSAAEMMASLYRERAQTLVGRRNGRAMRVFGPKPAS